MASVTPRDKRLDQVTKSLSQARRQANRANPQSLGALAQDARVPARLSTFGSFHARWSRLTAR